MVSDDLRRLLQGRLATSEKWPSLSERRRGRAIIQAKAGCKASSEANHQARGESLASDGQCNETSDRDANGSPGRLQDIQHGQLRVDSSRGRHRLVIRA